MRRSCFIGMGCCRSWCRWDRIESVYVLNVLFSTMEDVAALWTVETHDPTHEGAGWGSVRAGTG